MLFREAIQEETGSAGSTIERGERGPLFQPNAAVVPRVLEGCLLYAKSMVETHRRLFKSSQAEYVESCGGMLMFVSPDSPLTQVLSLGIAQSVSSKEIEFVRDFLHSRGAQFRYRVTPFTHPSVHSVMASLDVTFESSGFQIFRKVKPDYKAAASSVETGALDSVEDWKRIFIAAFYCGETSQEIEELALTLFHASNTRIAGAWIDGKLAGAATVCFLNGLASLNAACTLPEFRRRGVQRALIQKRLEIAAQHGCNLAMSSVAPASISLRNHLREGFEIAYPTMVFKENKKPD